MYIPSYDEIVFCGKVLVGAGTVLSVIFVPIFKYCIIPIYQKLILLKQRIQDDYAKWLNLADTATMVHEIITKELQTNGGTSIKDCIRRIENRLLIIDAKHKAFLSLENEPIWESNELGECVWANHSYLKVTGFEFNYLKNAGWISIINEKDRSRVREEWNMAVKEKRVFSCEYTINRYDGTKIKVYGNGFPILSILDNTVTGYIGRLSFCESSTN